MSENHFLAFKDLGISFTLFLSPFYFEIDFLLFSRNFFLIFLLLLYFFSDRNQEDVRIFERIAFPPFWIIYGQVVLIFFLCILLRTNLKGFFSLFIELLCTCTNFLGEVFIWLWLLLDFRKSQDIIDIIMPLHPSKKPPDYYISCNKKP